MFGDRNEISRELNGKTVILLESVNSTNDYGKKLAREGYGDWTVIIGKRQTRGRGRLGRSWESGSEKGIWMSVILKPSLAPEKAQVITLAASVAVCRGIWDILGIKAGIKWPNDIVYGGKKICGILTEISTGPEGINHIITGIGINVNQSPEDFKPDIRDRASSLKLIKGEGEDLLKRPLLISVLKHFEKYLEQIHNMKTGLLMDKWREYSHTLGREVSVVLQGESFTGIAKDITEEGRLIIRDDSGYDREILGGEIRLKGSNGYWL